MKHFRWLQGLCLAAATIALIGLPPARAIAEALDGTADQLPSTTTPPQMPPY
jgi:hypothetical protein